VVGGCEPGVGAWEGECSKGVYCALLVGVGRTAGGIEISGTHYVPRDLRKHIELCVCYITYICTVSSAQAKS
jgi:hypothetical protein